MEQILESRNSGASVLDEQSDLLRVTKCSKLYYPLDASGWLDDNPQVLSLQTLDPAELA